MTSALNDNRSAALRAGLEAAEEAMCGQDDDEEVVGNLSYVLALALEHRLDSPGKGLPESVTDLMRRITEAASDILSDWNIGKTGGLKRGREFVVICDSVAGTKREGRR